MSRGYFAIGIFNNKTPSNLGTLWRTAYQLGAAFIFTIGHRYPRQPSDTTNAPKHIPLYEFLDWEDFLTLRPKDCPLVGIEMGGRDLLSFAHPERAIYVLGAEDHGLPEKYQNDCQAVVSIPSVRTASFNVAVAGAIVMYDRFSKIA